MKLLFYLPLLSCSVLAKAIPQPQAGVQGGVTPDGTCGGANGYLCSNSLYGQCCGPYGYCGSDPSDCEVGVGCQMAYGNCSGSITTSSCSTTSSCTTSSSTISSSSSIPPVYGSGTSNASSSTSSTESGSVTASASSGLSISVSSSGISGSNSMPGSGSGSEIITPSTTGSGTSGSESSPTGSLTVSWTGSLPTGSLSSSLTGSGSPSTTASGSLSESLTSATTSTGSGSLTLSGSASSSLPSGSSSSISSSVSPTPTAYYHLRTHVLAGQPWAGDLDGLYLSAYSTRAGFNDVVFYATKDVSQVGWFGESDTVLHWFEPRNDTAGAVTFTLVMDYIQTDDWAQVSIDKGPGTAGLVLDFQKGLVVSSGFAADVWNGWFVCRWWHAALPQLFWLITPPNQIADLEDVTNCAVVNLIPELVLVP